MPNTSAAQHQINVPTVMLKREEDVYGMKYLPKNPAAERFATLVGRQAIPEWALVEIKALGYKLDIKD